MSAVERALAYARQGLPVFPCSGKVPVVSGGFKAATTDEAQIRRWWEATPGANVAIPTGIDFKGKRLIVLDPDGEDGQGSLAGLEREHGELPSTRTVKTPRGQHLWFWVPFDVQIGNSAGKLGPGLDVRGVGGYVLVPGSAGYEWEGRKGELPPVAEMPGWLVELLRKPDPPPRPPLEPRTFDDGDGSAYGLRALADEAEAVRTAPEGQRNATLNEAAFSLGQLEAGGELAPGVADEALRAAALAAGLGASEVEKTLRSGLDAGRQEPRRAPLVEPPSRVNGNGSAATAQRTARTGELERDAEPRARLIAPLASEIKPERVQWLWKDWLAAGKLVTLTGDPGMFKSTLTVDFAARVTTGTPWPDGGPCEPGGVLILSAEDGAADTIVPRLAAGGAELARVRVVQALVDKDGEIRPLSIPDDLAVLEENMQGVKLIIVDPFNSYLDGRIDSHRDHDVRRALAPLAALAERTGACVLVIRHWNKSQGKSIYRGSGSVAFIAAARVGLVVAPDPDDEDGVRRILAVEKSNIGPIPPSRAYSSVYEPDYDCVRIAWHGTSERKADELASHHAEAERTKADDAEAFLLNTLEDGRRPSLEVKEQAKRAGIADITLRRAREKLAIEDDREGFPAVTFWRLPDGPYSHAHRSRAHPLGADMSTTVDSAQPSGMPGPAESSRDHDSVSSTTEHDCEPQPTPDGTNGSLPGDREPENCLIPGDAGYEGWLRKMFLAGHLTEKREAGADRTPSGAAPIREGKGRGAETERGRARLRPSGADGRADVTDRLLTTRETAELLRVSPETTLRYWRKGLLDGFRLNGGTGPLRFTPAAIDAFSGGKLSSATSTIPALRSVE
ncbi:MAG: bifunctional DNA primase/polymerase [Gaiellales bacterium]